jgi:hypothetical protein
MDCPECNKSIPARFSGNIKRCKECWEKMTHKSCTRCEEYLPIDNFIYSNKKTKTRVAQCKVCTSKLYRGKYSNKYKKGKYVKKGNYRNPIPKNERKSIYHTEQSDKVTDWYVKKCLYVYFRRKGIKSIKHSEIPQELVETTRKSILLRREIEGKRKTNNKY